MSFWCLQFFQKTNFKIHFLFVFWKNWKKQDVLSKLTDLSEFAGNHDGNHINLVSFAPPHNLCLFTNSRTNWLDKWSLKLNIKRLAIGTQKIFYGCPSFHCIFAVWTFRLPCLKQLVLDFFIYTDGITLCF